MQIYSIARHKHRVTLESNFILNPKNPNRNLVMKSLYHLQGAMLRIAYVLTATIVLLLGEPIDAYRNNNTGKWSQWPHIRFCRSANNFRSLCDIHTARADLIDVPPY